MKNNIKLRIISALLENLSFENPDIGPVNEIIGVNEFIISIPKCATTSIQRGLERVGRKAIHAHNNPSTFEALRNGKVLRAFGVDLEALIKARLSQNAAPIYIFFGYREPVSWYLSLAGHFGLPLTHRLNEEICHNLDWEYPWNFYTFDKTLNLIKNVSGINIFDTKFNKRQGYSLISTSNIHLLVYRIDKMKELEGFIKTHIDKDFVMKKERRNDDAAYIDYIEKFKLKLADLNALYSTRQFKHFYDKEDTELLVEKYVYGRI